MAKDTLAEKPLPKNKLKFVAEYVQDGNGTQAAIKAFKVKNPNVAHNKAHRLLRNATIQDAIAKALPDDLLAKVHKEGLEATQPLVIKGQIEEYADYGVRHRYLDTAYKIKQKYTEAPQVTNIFVPSVENMAIILEAEKKLKASIDG